MPLVLDLTLRFVLSTALDYLSINPTFALFQALHYAAGCSALSRERYEALVAELPPAALEAKGDEARTLLRRSLALLEPAAAVPAPAPTQAPPPVDCARCGGPGGGFCPDCEACDTCCPDWSTCTDQTRDDQREPEEEALYAADLALVELLHLAPGMRRAEEAASLAMLAVQSAVALALVAPSPTTERLAEQAVSTAREQLAAWRRQIPADGTAPDTCERFARADERLNTLENRLLGLAPRKAAA